MPPHIRPAAAADRRQIENILRNCGNFRPEEIDIALEVWDDGIRQPGVDYHLLCAETRGRLAGYIGYGPIPLTVGCWDLYWIAVDPAQGRHGIGSALLRAMEDELRDRNARQIHIETSSLPDYQAARDFYTRHGFTLAASLPDFYRPGDDKLLFVRFLSPS
ncbi:MAG: hypothetical protein BWK76_22280 [Desulfobulbaceae bacterium A2]|nr:MAG: hypothetical protein BWK76_22280 [Desulfobulbaceae bacterium A2]